MLEKIQLVVVLNHQKGSDLHWASTQEFLPRGEGPRTLDVMSEAHARPAVQVSESLSWAEICARYCDQWVALVEIEWEDEDVVRAARVAGAGPRRADPLVQARALPTHYEEIGHFYTGRVRAPLRGFFVP